MSTPGFWKAAFERAVKTFAQAVVALAGASSVDVFSLSFVNSLKAAAVAAVLSVFTSLASSFVGNAGPSLANESLTQ